MRSYIPEGTVLIPPESKRVFKGIIFDVYQWEQEQFDGTYQTFEMLKRPDTVQILAIKDGKLVIQEQEQPHSGVFYDFPSGRHDVESENELEGAKRELLEETGMQFARWKLVHCTQPSRKMDYFIYTFVATEFIDQVEQRLDPGEKITIMLKTFDEVKSLLQNKKALYMGNRVLRMVRSFDELLALPDIR
jgi:ADP-ribose pyrophosphatase